jgi:glucosylceramidase
MNCKITEAAMKKILLLVCIFFFLFYQNEVKSADTKISSSVTIFQTAKDTNDRLSKKADLQFGHIPSERFNDNRLPSIFVDDHIQYQTIIGFGGAFTEAAAYTLSKLGPQNREKVFAAYFDSNEGNGYTLCRTHINSCDFSLGNYAYTEVDGDTNLTHFSLERDQKYLIPFIQEAMKITGTDLHIFASPWSPPAWMKTTGKMNQGGKLKPEYRSAWAKYYCRYIKEYQKLGIPIWGITVQNEPEATQTWDSCVYTAEEERDFVRDYLGPRLVKEGLSNVHLIIWDHNRNRMYERAKVVLDDPQAWPYVWGIGFHWYSGDNFDNVQMVHDAFPDKNLIFTEGCYWPFSMENIKNWDAGETYARSMIKDLNHWTVGWSDWNMLLDETGGPNHVSNFCLAPIIAETKNDVLHFMNSYYYIGHFSRFIRPGATRIICSSTLDDLEATAFLNKDGRIAVVVLNRSDHAIPFALKYQTKAVETASPAHSIETFIFASQ